jgi:hypothetical protein
MCYKYIIDKKRYYTTGGLKNQNLFYNGSKTSQIMIENVTATSEYSGARGCISFNFYFLNRNWNPFETLKFSLGNDTMRT